MYEIPEILVFVCLWMLFVFGAAETPWVKSTAMIAYMASAITASVMLAGLAYSWIGIALATFVFVAFLVALDWADHHGKTVVREAVAPDPIIGNDR